MAHVFSEAENKAWLAGLPKKSVAVKLIIRSADDKILLVKPNYKNTWQFPGGGVEQQEEPKEALVRELLEELGLELAQDALRIVGTVFRKEHDNLILIYELRKPLADRLTVEIAQDEIEQYEFVAANEVAPRLSDYYSAFWSNYLSE